MEKGYKVNHEIVSIIQERLQVYQQRGGESSDQNCAKELEQYTEVAKAFYDLNIYDLGAYSSARKCLAKQKQDVRREKGCKQTTAA
ncbi:NADH dehydrogenase [ubiquinone] 1 beta subcomplex subunit 10 [Lemmus lemmus]